MCLCFILYFYDNYFVSKYWYEYPKSPNILNLCAYALLPAVNNKFALFKQYYSAKQCIGILNIY